MKAADNDPIYKIPSRVYNSAVATDRFVEDLQRILENPQVVKRDTEFFPLQGKRGSFDSKASHMTNNLVCRLDDEELGQVQFDVVCQRPVPPGNAEEEFDLPLPSRIYTLADQPDDLRTISEIYPGQPIGRLFLAFGFMLPSVMDEKWHNEYKQDFRGKLRIKVTNHLTGLSFIGVEDEAIDGFNTARPNKEGFGALHFEAFYYEGETPDLTPWALKEKPHVKARQYETEAQRRFIQPFQLAFLDRTDVKEAIGITLETAR